MGVFLDIQGAFDNISTNSIVNSLRERDVDSKLCQWYQHYLDFRRIEVSYRGTKISRFLTRGTPQGGVLSPLACNLAFNKLLEQFDEGLVSVHGFADDAALIAVGKNPHVLRQRMQNATEKALAWGNSCGLQFSPSKTACILFHRRNKPIIPPELRMGNVDVPYSTSTRYLGVTVDQRLRWDLHINKVANVAKGKLLQLRNAMGKLWGTKPKMIWWMYTGIIRPSVTYGSIVWGHSSLKQHNLEKLRRVNRLALLLFGHFRRSTPTAGLEVALNIMPLHTHILYEAALAFERVLPTLSNKEALETSRSPGHRKFLKQLKMDLDLPSISVDTAERKHIWGNLFTVATKFSKDPPAETSDGINIYTDGSGHCDGKGSGFIAFLSKSAAGSTLHTDSFTLRTENSVYQSELYAIKKAAEWISRNIQNQIIYIFTDSRASIWTLLRNTVTSKLVTETMRALNHACGFSNTIRLKWVKAHAGHFGNEKADELANAGAASNNFVDDAPNPPESYRKLIFRRKLTQKWQADWEMRKDCRQTKLWFPQLSKRLSFSLLAQGRVNLSRMIQLITGHNFLNRHEALVNKTGDADCRLCLEDEETAIHVIAECPALARPRLQTFGKCFLALPLQWSIQEVASFIREAQIGFLFEPPNNERAAE